jgi:hypothetical protein
VLNKSPLGSDSILIPESVPKLDEAFGGVVSGRSELGNEEGGRLDDTGHNGNR